MTAHPPTPEHITKVLAEKSGIMLDLGCGAHKQPGFVGLDIRPLDGVDIVHNMESVPYPLPDECCTAILASHVLEHVDPARFGFVNVMNELWRIMKVGGRLMIAVPYAGSAPYWQDPTHVNGINEITLAYFAPKHISGLWGIYRPKPWDIKHNAWSINGCLEAVLEKLPESEYKASTELEKAQELLKHNSPPTQLYLNSIKQAQESTPHG